MAILEMFKRQKIVMADSKVRSRSGKVILRACEEAQVAARTYYRGRNLQDQVRRDAAQQTF
jgi:hypothetical protein